MQFFEKLGNLMLLECMKLQIYAASGEYVNEEPCIFEALIFSLGILIAELNCGKRDRLMISLVSLIPNFE